MSSSRAPQPTLPLLLYVEDEALIRFMVVDALEDAGFAALAATNATEALALLDARGPGISALITDINLGPALDGWHIARIARERFGDLPVIYVSGASSHEWSENGVAGSLMITKPFTPEQIAAAIGTLLVATETVGEAAPGLLREPNQHAANPPE